MEKGNYPLIITPDITVNLFKHPTVGLGGNDLVSFIPRLVEQNMEYSPVVLDKGFGLDAIEGAEYVSGERKALTRLGELVYDEVDRRMVKLVSAGARNFFDYNTTHSEEDRIKPRIIIFAGARMTRRSEELIRRLSSAYGKMTGLFPVYCYPTQSDISDTLLCYASVFVYANRDGVYIRDFDELLGNE